MTGGTVPLAATLATNAVFTSFIGDSKVIYCAGFSSVSFLFSCVSWGFSYGRQYYVGS